MKGGGFAKIAVRLALAAMALVPFVASADPAAWIHIDTGKGSLKVLDGERVLFEAPDIAVGRGGTSRSRMRGDQTTPLGDFRVVEVRDRAYFHRFFVLDYPNRERARSALAAGQIDGPTFDRISRAVEQGRMPPQNTALGGNIGIHGLGRGDPVVHEHFNWTQGCIALTNEEIDSLARWVRVGTRVVID